MFNQLCFKKLPQKVGRYLTSSLVFSISVFGLQSAALAQNQVGSTILVSGSRFEEQSNRIPANVKVISREEIEESSANSIPEVLSQLGGLIVRGNSLGQLSLGATVDIGGFGATSTSNTLVLVDGQRLTPIDQSSVPWNSVPIASIERIEIIQGGGSVQYGNNAVGGVINIITRDGGKEINQVSTKYGSFGTSISDVVLSKKIDNTSVRLTANTSHTQGWRENSAAHANTFGGSLSHSFGGLDKAFVEAYGNNSNNQFSGAVTGQVGQGNPRLVRPNNLGDFALQDGTRFRAGLAKSLGSAALFEGDLSYSDAKNQFNRPYYTGNTSFSSLSNIKKSQFDLTPRIKFNLGKLGETILGFDFNESKSSYGDNLNNSQSVRQLNRSVYFSQKTPLSDTFDLVGGFRRQIQDVTVSDIQTVKINATQIYAANAADLAVNYRYSKNNRIYLKWNQSFRFANTDEYWGYDPVTYARVFSGGSIKPQLSQGFELGGDWLIGESKLTAALFQVDTSDEIRLDPITFANINDKDIRRRGVSLDATFFPSKELTITSGGKYQRSYYTSGENFGKTISLVPDWTLYGRVNYRLTPKFQFGGSVNLVGNQYYDGDVKNSLSKMPVYAFADLYLAYQSGPWEGRFTIKNLGNTNYATYGLSYYSPDVYYYYPSDPRAYFLTVKYNFK